MIYVEGDKQRVLFLVYVCGMSDKKRFLFDIMEIKLIHIWTTVFLTFFSQI